MIFETYHKIYRIN